MSRVDRDHPVVRELVRLKAVRLDVYVSGETEPRKLSCVEGGRGKRWQRVAGAIDALTWERIEAYDGKGQLLHAFTAEVEEFDDGPPEDASALAREVARLVVANFRDVMREARSMMAVPLQAQADAMRAMSDALAVQRQVFDHALKVQAANAVAGGDDDAMGKLLQIGMMAAAGRSAPAPRPVAPPAPPAKAG